MSNRKDILLTQFRTCYHQDGWFAPLNYALKGLTGAQATLGGVQSANSIFGISQHLVFWNERYLQRFKGGTVPPLKIPNSETFECKDSCEIEKAWDDMRQRLDKVFTQWEEAIINCDDTKLDSRTNPDQDECWWTSLALLATHNAYHTGQIVHILKEQGLWKTWWED